jgi:hypothetical protein
MKLTLTRSAESAYSGVKLRSHATSDTLGYPGAAPRHTQVFFIMSAADSLTRLLSVEKHAQAVSLC